MRDEISAEVARREAGGSPLSEVLAGMAAAPAGARGDATRAWYAANGDIERAHTTGTFVREPRRGESGAVLVVYVDSKARVTDFSANSEVYLARLANVGMSFSKVEFRLSRYPRRPVSAAPAQTPARPAAPSRPRRPLSEHERSEIEALCAGLPQTLRPTVLKAMSASYEAELDER